MLTKAQHRALVRLADSVYATPADIGYAICPDRDPPLKGQGAGRIGGSMAKRLIDLGLVEDASHLRWGFSAYRITGAGRLALKSDVDA